MKNIESKLKEDIEKFLFSLPKPHFSPSVGLGKSKIAGIGLIARKDIAKGEIVVVELGPTVNRKLIEVIEALTGYECNLCIGWDEYILHAPLHKDYQGGYINHSCEPNVGLLKNGVWCAIVDIKKGEEIFCDYGTFETMPGWRMKCHCGAAHCRKVITGEDYKNKALRKKMGKWFAPYLREK